MRLLAIKIVLLSGFIDVSTILSAQASTPFKISGQVYSAADSIPLEGILINSYYGKFSTNHLGFFEFERPVEEYALAAGFEYDKNNKLPISFTDSGQAGRLKYLQKDTLIDIYSQHLKVYLETVR